LIRAEVLIEEAVHGGGEFVSLETADPDGDREDEVILRNRRLTIVVDPVSGDSPECDWKPACLNLCNSLTRREEPYHQRLLRVSPVAGKGEEGGARSIHHIEGLREGQGPPVIVNDGYPRRSLVDHMWRDGWDRQAWLDGVPSPGWRAFPYAGWRSRADERSVGVDCDRPAGRGYPALTKSVSLTRDDGAVRVAVRISGEGARETLRLGQEFNLTPVSIGDTVMETVDPHGRLTRVGLAGGVFREVASLVVRDTLGGYTLRFVCDAPLELWAAVLSTVSNSEAGCEQISQQISLLFSRTVRPGGTGLELSLRFAGP
jgi:hypothetical protein